MKLQSKIIPEAQSDFFFLKYISTHQLNTTCYFKDGNGDRSYRGIYVKGTNFFKGVI